MKQVINFFCYDLFYFLFKIQIIKKTAAHLFQDGSSFFVFFVFSGKKRFNLLAYENYLIEIDAVFLF